VTAYLFFFGQASSIEPAGASDTAVSTQTTKNFTYVTVQSGDSLWAIAERNSNGGDVRDFIQEIIALNNLTDSVVSAGMQLAIPRS
jgi:LysM repeat protein